MEWSRTKSTIAAAIYLSIVQPWIVDGDDFVAVGGMYEWQEKSKYSEKT
jgi:hypothetical protein